MSEHEYASTSLAAVREPVMMRLAEELVTFGHGSWDCVNGRVGSVDAVDQAGAAVGVGR